MNSASRNSSPAVDVNSTVSILSTIYLGVIGAAVFIVQPGFVQGMVESLGFGEQQAGFIASAEVWGIAATSVLLAFWAPRFNWVKFLNVSLLLFVGGNLASLTTGDLTSFGLLRFIVGLGSGGLISLTFTVMGLTRFPERNLGYLIIGVLIYSACSLWVMPTALAAIGLNGIIVFFALFGASGWFCLRHMPESGEAHYPAVADSVDISTGLRVTAVLAMFIYFLAIGGTWAYLFLIGLNAGINEQEVANGLFLSQLSGIAGALIVTVAAHRLGRTSLLTVGVPGGGMILLVLFGQFSALTYVVAVCIYCFAWNMSHPLLLASMASFERKGRVVHYAVAAQMSGLAIGPAGAAALLLEDDYSQVLRAGIVLFFVAYLLLLAPLLNHRRLMRERSLA
ncbi:MAG: MFS transporter [Gammaproteobacteria bacterium]|nr:MFS transporter [Gammaproteobacteria bacterium]